MDFKELKQIVVQGENGNVEFKRKVRHPEKIVREFVALANTDGGKIFIGVDDNLTIPGLKYPEEDHFILHKALNELCKPPIEFSFEIIEIPNEMGVLHYSIPASLHKPHFAFLHPKHRFGKAFVRIEDKSVQASREYRVMLKRKNAASRPLEYGSNEKILLNYLGNHERITLQEYQKLSNLPKEEASHTLINLAASSVIRIIPGEQEDWFVSME